MRLEQPAETQAADHKTQRLRAGACCGSAMCWPFVIISSAGAPFAPLRENQQCHAWSQTHITSAHPPGARSPWCPLGLEQQGQLLEEPQRWVPPSPKNLRMRSRTSCCRQTKVSETVPDPINSCSALLLAINHS